MRLPSLPGRAKPLIEGPPNTTCLYCPLCGSVIHAYSDNDLRHPEDITRQVELFATGHFRRYHARRWWLYRRTGWRWPIAGWPL